MSGKGSGSLVIDALTTIAQRLEAEGVSYAVMGGIAMNLAGRARFTRDVDLLIAVPPSPQPAPSGGGGTAERSERGGRGQRPGGIDALLDRLQEMGCTPVHEPPLRRVDHMQFLQLTYAPAGAMHDIRVDLIVADSPHLSEALSRAVPAVLAGKSVPTLAVEDLIVLKLLAGRVIDRVDAAELLRIHRDRLDTVYLDKWTAALGLRDEWARTHEESLRLPT